MSRQSREKLACRGRDYLGLKGCYRREAFVAFRLGAWAAPGVSATGPLLSISTSRSARGGELGNGSGKPASEGLPSIGHR